MNNTKFRGKMITTNRWVYGHYAYVYDKDLQEYYHVIYEDGVPFIVRYLTIEKYTGIKDRDGIEIYEGQTVKHSNISYTDCSRSDIESVGEEFTGKMYYAEGLWLGVEFSDGTGKIFMPGQLISEGVNLELKVLDETS